jgi:VWFA-related protein
VGPADEERTSGHKNKKQEPEMMRKALGLLATAVLALAPLGGLGAIAQDPPKPQQRPTFRTGAELVRVDVVVLDRQGLPVPTLTANDFELQEEGAAQEIKTFQFVKADGNPEANDERTLAIRSRSHAASEASRENVRLFLIFWDEYHIGQMASATRARNALAHFVRTAFGPTDIVAFMDPLTPIDAITFTRDRLELFERTRKLTGRSGVYVPTRSAVEDAHLERGDVERLRSEVTVSALKAATVHLGGMRDGRKSIILISEGLRGIMRDSQTMLTDLVRTANDNNTAIYAIDPRGFGPQRFMSLFEGVAADTGGQFFRTNDLTQAFSRVVSESSGFYLLGYSPAERPLDGRFHKIKVRVKQQGLEVRARSGYWAPSVSEMETARKKSLESELPPDVQQALGTLPSASARRAIDLWIGADVQAEAPIVRVSWAPRPPAAGNAPATAVAVTASQNGATVFDAPVGLDGGSFPAPAGPLQLTITARDAAGEIVDKETRTVRVPDRAAPLWISTPAVFRTQNALEYRNLDRSPGARPFPGREFARSDRLLVRFSVQGSAAPAATVSARMLSQWGKDLAALPLTRPAEAGAYEIDLPLSSVARGEFLIAVTAASGTDRVRAFVPLRIAR